VETPKKDESSPRASSAAKKSAGDGD